MSPVELHFFETDRDTILVWARDRNHALEKASKIEALYGKLEWAGSCIADPEATEIRFFGYKGGLSDWEGPSGAPKESLA